MFWVYLYLIVFILFDIIILTLGVEQLLMIFKRVAPEVPSTKYMRGAVLDAINKEMPGVKSIVDIGSGWGGMVRMLARRFPNASVTGIEIMPTPYVCSWLSVAFYKNVKIVFGNAFKYLGAMNGKADVGIAYLLTPMMHDVERYLPKFKILMVLDFPLPNTKPVRKVKLHRDRLGQHWLYIYKN